MLNDLSEVGEYEIEKIWDKRKQDEGGMELLGMGRRRGDNGSFMRMWLRRRRLTSTMGDTIVVLMHEADNDRCISRWFYI